MPGKSIDSAGLDVEKNKNGATLTDFWTAIRMNTQIVIVVL
jgi:hypothetical protein